MGHCLIVAHTMANGLTALGGLIHAEIYGLIGLFYSNLCRRIIAMNDTRDLEYCNECDCETGNAGIGEDSLHCDGKVYCDDCWSELPHKQAQEIDCNRIIMDRDLGNIRKLEARIKELEGELRGARNAIISAHAEYALAPGMECKCKWCYPQEPSHD